ncbi:MAG: hypothetical protein NXI27_08435 [Alphaproteobacteria bacterium]|nr:hypothetical protein [Alphaproteobacteria bacterium]
MTADKKVFVSLTTIPDRIAGIEPCIRSLQEQTVPPEAIFLCIPRTYKLHGSAAEVPASLINNYPLLKIVPCADDFGPGTKVLGSLDWVNKDADSLMVLVDDDSTYRDYMLEEFVSAFRADSDHAYSFYVSNYRGIHVGQGCDGFAIPATALKGLRSYFERIRDNEFAFFVDDLWISHYLQLNGMQAISLQKKIRRKGLSRGTIYETYNGVSALLHMKGKYKRWKCMAETRKFLKQEFGL